MKYIKKPIAVEATQWFKNGDHPADASEWVKGRGEPFLSEGKIVRRYRRPDVSISGELLCKHCDVRMHEHGWIDTLEGGHIVCPGDFIITGVRGERYPCKAEIFEETYEPVE